MSNAKSLRLGLTPLSVAFLTSAKISQQLEFQLCIRIILARCTFDIIATTKIRWLIIISPNPYSLLPAFLGVLKSLAASSSLLRMLTEPGAKPFLEVYWTHLSNCGAISPYVHCQKHETPPPPTAFLGIFFLILERDHLEGLLYDLLWFLKPQEVCSVENKGVNIRNYVDLSGIYPIRNIAYVFWAILVNPPSLWVLDSNWSLTMNFKAFREIEGWLWVRQSFIVILRW